MDPPAPVLIDAGAVPPWPAGLRVRVSRPTDPGSVVEEVHRGAFAAWSRQLAGDVREARPGDLIVEANGAMDPDAARHQFLT
eukprot:605028-Alexandrium_andersonii.AAC.1